MNDIAIRVENLSKEYKIGAVKEPYNTLRDELTHGFVSLFRRNGRSHGNNDRIWALRDVSFDVKQGEVVGIIGRNGAGKSTLLKILSRITEPTKGRVEIYGRVGCLLEVGTGFHPELTGRENVYLNGAVLGMSYAEIKRKFDEIVAFSEVEKFIDTPVKRYSSGMKVRLAFSVAAHLEPEILIIDEVLAVGDIGFQRKCLGKMEEAAHCGRTVFLVSHNIAAIENMCTKTMLLDHGSLAIQGPTKQVVNHYLQTVLPSAIEGFSLCERTDRSGNGKIRLMSFHVEDKDGNKLAAVCSGMDVVFVIGFQCLEGENPKNVDIGISLGTNKDQLLCVLYSSFVGQTFQTVPRSGVFRCHVTRFPFSPGRYYIGARVVVGGEEADWPRDGVGYLTVEVGDFYHTGSKGFTGTAPVLMNGLWKVQ